MTGLSGLWPSSDQTTAKQRKYRRLMRIGKIGKVLGFREDLRKVLILLGKQKRTELDFQSLALPPELPRHLENYSIETKDDNIFLPYLHRVGESKWYFISVF